jgi:hypothetical protein
MHGQANALSADAWHMALFDGLGPDNNSNSKTCNEAGVWCVCIDDSYPDTQVYIDKKVVCISMHLDPSVTVAQLVATVWHVSGLLPSDLISVSACPPCDTFTSLNNCMQYPHRWPNGEAADGLAVEHDKLLLWLILILFGVQ